MDSLASVVQAIQQAAGESGVSVAESAIREVIGLGQQTVMQHLFADLPETKRQQIYQRYKALYAAAVCGQEVLFEGVREVLTDLHARGYPLAIATGKGRAGLEAALITTQLASLFVITRCVDDAFPKPHPLMVEQILSATGAVAARTLLIGDTVHDMQLAANANVAACAVSYGVHSAADLLKYKPMACFDHIRQLPAWLETMG